MPGLIWVFAERAREFDALTQGVQCRMVLVAIIFFRFFLIDFLLVIAIFDLVHDADAIFHLP